MHKRGSGVHVYGYLLRVRLLKNSPHGMSPVRANPNTRHIKSNPDPDPDPRQPSTHLMWCSFTFPMSHARMGVHELFVRDLFRDSRGRDACVCVCVGGWEKNKDEIFAYSGVHNSSKQTCICDLS